MFTKGTSFASYSRVLSWIVSFICLLVALFVFLGEESNASLRGFLWLALAFVFAISAILLSRDKASGEGSDPGSPD